MLPPPPSSPPEPGDELGISAVGIGAFAVFGLGVISVTALIAAYCRPLLRSARERMPRASASTRPLCLTA